MCVQYTEMRIQTLIDRYLTNGGRSIPMYLLLGKDGEVIAKWGPRAAQLQEYVMRT